MLSNAKLLVKKSIIQWLLWRETRADPMHAAPFQDLSPQQWDCAVDPVTGHLCIGGVDVMTLVQRYGTPLHVVNKHCLLARYTQFVGAFRAVYPRTVLATSYKTNPVPGVLATLHAAGTYAEGISHLELWLALQLGVAPEKIILNGPGKTDAALQLAVQQRIGMVNIDGPDEIPKLAAFARREGVRQRVGLRVITSVGWSAQFGLSIATGAATAAFAELRAHPELIPCGLHLHLGTGIQSIATYVRAVEEVVAFAAALYEQQGIVIDHFDLGGGFGVPTVRSMGDWDLRMQALGYPARRARPNMLPTAVDYAQALMPVLRRLAAWGKACVPTHVEPLVVFEPGRAITSASHVLLLSVLAQKNLARGPQVLIMDGGKNVTMPLGWETHQIYNASQMNASARAVYDVFGPLCHPGDVLVRNYRLPTAQPEDVLAIMDAGAYFIPNQMNFSNPRPAIVMVDAGASTVLRRGETFADVFHLDTHLEALLEEALINSK